MSRLISQDEKDLLHQLIELYQKLLRISYADGFLAARRLGPDIMDVAGRLHNMLPEDDQLAQLCDELLDVAWGEYIMDPKDVDCFVHKAYRGSLRSKEAVLKRLLAVHGEWEREEWDGITEEEEKGYFKGGVSGDGVCEDGECDAGGKNRVRSDGGGDNEDNDDNGSGDEDADAGKKRAAQVMSSVETLDDSPEVLPGRKIAENACQKRDGRKGWYSRIAVGIAAVTIGVNWLV